MLNERERIERILKKKKKKSIGIMKSDIEEEKEERIGKINEKEM